MIPQEDGIFLDIPLEMPDFAIEEYLVSDQKRPKAKPHVPTWLKEIVCSEESSPEEKRAAVENAILGNGDFVAWGLLALFNLETALERAEDTRPGLGFSAWDGDEFRDMARHLLKNGYLKAADVEYCQRTNTKGRPFLGRHAEQLAALIALSADYPQCIPRHFAKKMRLDIPRKSRKQKRSSGRVSEAHSGGSEPTSVAPQSPVNGIENTL